MSVNRRSFFKFLGLAPLAPVAVDVAGKALAQVPAATKPVHMSDFVPAHWPAGCGDFVPVVFTIPPQPEWVRDRQVGRYAQLATDAEFQITGGFYASGTPKTAHVWQNNSIESAGGKS